jgi:hypothetical protein
MSVAERLHMRTRVIALVAGMFLAAGASAQSGVTPPVRVGVPQPAPPMLPPLPETPPPPTGEFGIGDLPPGNLIPSPFVRPPMPVTGAPIEVPPGPHLWVKADYLMWNVKGGLLPPLVTSAFGSPSMASPDPLSAFMVSESKINSGLHDGFRVAGGIWLDKPDGTGVELRYARFFHGEDVQDLESVPRTFLGRPFWDVVNNAPALFLLSNPAGTMQGFAQIRTSFDSEGFEANVLRRGPAMVGEEFHWIMGLRYWEMQENLTVAAGSQVGGMRVGTFDTFATRNRFFGSQIGGQFSFTRNNLQIDLTLKVASGAMLEDASVLGGATALLPNGVRVDRPGGFLALASNSGGHSRTKFAVLPEGSLAIAYCVTDNVKLRLGYDAMYVYKVIRPGEQVNLQINPSLLPFSPTPTAPLRPDFRFNDETFWMQGFSFGMVVEF